MRLTRQKRTTGAPELNMAAMVDVVLLLLIFFMCTSSFQRPEQDLPSRLPQTGGAVTTEPEEFEPVRIRLSVTGEASVLIECDRIACATLDALEQHLTARRAVADVRVIISGEGDVPFGDMVGALDACYRADLRRVAFSAQGL